MNYKKLKKFQKIINCKDFDYISSVKTIKELENIIMHHISNSDGKEVAYVKLLEMFSDNLRNFYNSISNKDIFDLKKGYVIVIKELRKCINLFSEPEFKRKSISNKYYKKFNKNILYGLSKLFDGIRIAFNPNIVSSTKINKKQYVRYILNVDEGLGGKYLFNKSGKHSFMNKIVSLNMQELIVTARLLIDPPKNQIRLFNSWRDLGLGYAPVRILSEHRIFRKDKIVFLYRLSEHKLYELQLKTPADKITFIAA